VDAVGGGGWWGSLWNGWCCGRRWWRCDTARKVLTASWRALLRCLLRLVVGRIIFDTFELHLKFPLSLLGCFKLSTLGCESSFLLLCFFLCCLLASLFFGFLDLAGFDLFFQCFKTSLCRFLLLLELLFF
jgi:hypothetical protein